MTRAQQAALWACVVGLAVGLIGGAKLWSSGQDTADDAARAAHRAAHAASTNRQTLCAISQLVADVADPTDTSKYGRDSRAFLAHVHDINCPPNAVSFPRGGGHQSGSPPGQQPGGHAPPPSGSPPKPQPKPEPGGNPPPHHEPPPDHNPPPGHEPPPAPEPHCTIEVNPVTGQRVCIDVTVP